MRFRILFWGTTLCVVVVTMLAAVRGGQWKQDDTQPSRAAPSCFTSRERETIRSLWRQPNRYKTVRLPTRANITPEGSVWMKAFRALPANPRWSEWLRRRLAQNRIAASSDDAGGNSNAPEPPSADLLDALPEPPLPATFYERVTPTRHTIRFTETENDANPFIYEDNVSFGDRADYFPSYRSRDGVRAFGKRIRDYSEAEKRTLTNLLEDIGLTDTERRVLLAVSALEGGFEAVNTYDTGGVSIGLIQFTTGFDGSGSLVAVLQRAKADAPNDFERHFRRFGVDVGKGGEASNGLLCVVDPATGEERSRSEAVRAIIRDKRLTAVFERAGRLGFWRVAQIQVAKSRYYPARDTLQIRVRRLIQKDDANENRDVVRMTFFGDSLDVEEQVASAIEDYGQNRGEEGDTRLRIEENAWSAPLLTIFRSEAGLATLMDRKVQVGNLRLVATMAAKILREKRLSKLEDLARCERELIALVRNRADFLQDRTLSQPSPR